MRYTIIRLLLTLICCLPTFASAATSYPLHASWSSYSAPSGYTLSGFKLYQGGAFACQTLVSNATSMDCTVSLTTATTNFTLAATFSDGTESLQSAPVAFTTPTGSTTAPTAAISSSTAAGQAPLAVTFNGSGSKCATTATITSYSWNFGDGSPAATGATTSHSFTTAGTYTTKLTITDSTGLTNSASTPVVVTASTGTGTGTGTNKAPTAAASATPVTGTSPLAVTFDGSASTDADGTVASYLWNFGDGSTAAGKTASHTYTTAGTFTATLTVTDNKGATGSTSKTITAQSQQQTASATIWPATTVPGVIDTGANVAAELGTKFRSDSTGFITGIRFYKASSNTGAHIANLWSSTGTRLATATFTNETGAGWQQVNFATPVAVTANTVYVASYHTNTGHFSEDDYYFSGKGMDSPPLHALADGVSGVNGVYALGSSSIFPSTGNLSSNFWVDVVFQKTAPTQPTNTSIWPTTTVPAVADAPNSNQVQAELGAKFRSDSNGFITGIRFYKASTNTGTHVANLWTNTGTKLATATFTNETGSGWQQVTFSTPVAIKANTVYVASYHTNTGHFSEDDYYFSGKGMDTPPLHALADGVSGASGVYALGSTSIFPSTGYLSSNFWVDVMFHQ